MITSILIWSVATLIVGIWYAWPDMVKSYDPREKRLKWVNRGPRDVKKARQYLSWCVIGLISALCVYLVKRGAP